MSKRSFPIILLLVTLLLAACGAAAAPQAQPAPDEFSRGSLPGAPPAMEAPESSVGVGGGEIAQDAVGGTGSVQVDRLVIKNASLSLLVKDAAGSGEAIGALAESLGGYVVTSNVFKTTFGPNSVEATQASIVIRVPAERLTEALTKIKAMAVEVSSENVWGQDVTAEYTDLQSRLRNLEAAEKQLQNIMDGATRTEDVLAVYNQLVATRGEIEVIKGQIKYYEDSAAFSQISIDLIPDVVAQPLDIGGWRPEGVAKQAVELLIQSLQTLVSLLIYVAICGVPFALIVGLPAWLGMRAMRRRRLAAKSKAVMAEPVNEIKTE